MAMVLRIFFLAQHTGAAAGCPYLVLTGWWGTSTPIVIVNTIVVVVTVAAIVATVVIMFRIMCGVIRRAALDRNS